MPYIIPIKKKDKESRKENLTRRLEENIEFYHACGRMSHVSLLEKVKDYIYHSNPPREKRIEISFKCVECGYPLDGNYCWKCKEMKKTLNT